MRVSALVLARRRAHIAGTHAHTRTGVRDAAAAAVAPYLPVIYHVLVLVLMFLPFGLSVACAPEPWVHSATATAKQIHMFAV